LLFFKNSLNLNMGFVIEFNKAAFEHGVSEADMKMKCRSKFISLLRDRRER